MLKERERGKYKGVIDQNYSFMLKKVKVHDLTLGQEVKMTLEC